ncbi:hypothetical protein EHS25_004541 [Saitozyma podzolica]|uniref:OPA3-like protein n=1 Tax=Saitozyma podzolica TaxID=1890683 RepID=A0A427YUM0_9TREE|nr:hypothetical protein EHS25_004541 [Saitozyma podzolica]
MGLLNEEAKNIKPLNDTRAVQNGATTLAESFLFFVGAGLVLGESYRSSRKEGKRRDEVQERLEGLESEVKALRGLLEGGGAWQRELGDVRERSEEAGKVQMDWSGNNNLEKVMSTVVNNGLRAGWLSLGHGDGMGEIMPLIQQRQADAAGQAGNALGLVSPSGASTTIPSGPGEDNA